MQRGVCVYIYIYIYIYIYSCLSRLLYFVQYGACTRQVHPLHILYSPNLSRHFRNNVAPKDVPGYRVCHTGRMSRKIRLFPRVSSLLPASTASDERREWISGAVVTSTTKRTLDSSFSFRAFQRRKSWNFRRSFVLRTCEHILIYNFVTFVRLIYFA